MTNEADRQDVLGKFTKANLKLCKALDGTQIVQIIDSFVLGTCMQVTIQFEDFVAFRKLVQNMKI